MAIEKINKMLSNNPRYKRLQRPLQAAEICNIAAQISEGRFRPISFKNGLLTLAVESSGAAANLQSESGQIIDKINHKIGKNIVEQIRYRIAND